MIEIISIPRDITDERIRDVIAIYNPFIRCAKRAPGLIISGYEDDLRELSEISEVQELCRRLVDSGFIGMVDTGLPNPKIPLTLGSYIIWKIANGEVRRRMFSLTPPELREFMALLSKCNQKCDQISGETHANH